MDAISSDYIMIEGKRVNIILGQSQKCILLLTLHECKLFMTLLCERDILKKTLPDAKKITHIFKLMTTHYVHEAVFICPGIENPAQS